MMTRRSFIASMGLAGAAVALATAGVSGAAADVWLDQPLRLGDMIQFEGTYAINPITQRTTPYLQWFVVTAVDGDTIETHPRRKASA